MEDSARTEKTRKKEQAEERKNRRKIMNETGCDCNSTCSRKSGKKKGCPCRDQKKKCDEYCSCGTKKKPCKNKLEVTNIVPSNNDRSLLTQMENDLEKEQAEIQGIIRTLDSATLQHIILKLSVAGSGSADFIKNILADGGSQGNEDSEKPDWCKCGLCRPMSTERENVCCKRKICITRYTKFKKIVLDKDVLDVAITTRADVRAEEIQFRNSDYRKAAYYQYIIWKYGTLGRYQRRVIAACVVKAIRLMYPEASGVYLGFKSS